METVLCYKSDWIDSQWNAIQSNINIQDVCEYYLGNSHAYFAPKDNIEYDLNFKQLIPYIILTHNDKYLMYTRTPKGGENRLYNKKSLGVGGHINIGDIRPLHTRSPTGSRTGSSPPTTR